jgi:CRP/FNR family transcriptional regulator
MHTDWTIFKKFPPFATLSTPALQALAGVATHQAFADGQILQFESESGQAVFFLLKGSVRVYRSNYAGREQNLAHLQPGEIFNLPVAFLKSPQTKANAVTLEPVELLSIPFAEFRRLATQNPEIAMTVITTLSKKLADLTETVYDLSLRSVRSRLAHFLLQHTQTPTRPWTQSDIAVQIGTVREVVGRTLKSFVAEGFIQLDRQQIVIVDPQGLERASEE